MLHSMAEFLAHAIALEAHSAERFEALANALEARSETAVSELFRRMAQYSRLHLEEVRTAAGSLTLPAYRQEDYLWPDAEPPETIPAHCEQTGITPKQALLEALRSEERGEAFYAAVAATTTDSAVRHLAEEFAAEESGHVSMLSQWLVSLPDHGAPPSR
ncbi:ferritin-like domain-containing protein [Novispirillum itersonii]|uniref:ferritin-like domain-containing protein n=1 Tax=Novispirillum itersonii TaxID=189 RepID=UPI00036D828C|nr:ferritin family protein [Novispirillum itersonii]